MFHRRRSRSRVGKRRKSKWGSSEWAAVNSGTVAAGTVKYDTAWVKVPAGVENTASGDLEPEDWTLTRLLPYYTIAVQSASDNIYNAILAAGILVWEGVNDTPPSELDVPFPVFDGDADWIWSDFSMMSGHFAIADVFSQQGNNDLGSQSRAMRKLSSRKGLLLVIGVDNSLGTTPVNTMNWTFACRAHFKLP